MYRFNMNHFANKLILISLLVTVVLAVDQSSTAYSDKVVDLLIDVIKQLEARVETLEKSDKNLANSMHQLETMVGDINKEQRTGATYVRWGRNVCKANTTRLYKGYASGPPSNKHGSGSNYLCLPEEPQWKNYVSGHQDGNMRYRGNVGGVQYAIYHSDIFSYSSNDEHSIGNNPAPCAVCYVGGRSTVLMIPAKTQCPHGWTIEYAGYLVSAYGNGLRTAYRSNYICMDEAPEVAVGGINRGQAVVYPVEVTCGALPCSLYINNRELACVVCSK